MQTQDVPYQPILGRFWQRQSGRRQSTSSRRRRCHRSRRRGSGGTVQIFWNVDAREFDSIATAGKFSTGFWVGPGALAVTRSGAGESPDGNVITATYDEDGNLASVTDPEGHDGRRDRGDAWNMKSPAPSDLSDLERINDAEMHLLRAAETEGATINAIGATRPMCPLCQERLPDSIPIVTELGC
jgi:hypothetical protein